MAKAVAVGSFYHRAALAIVAVLLVTVVSAFAAQQGGAPGGGVPGGVVGGVVGGLPAAPPPPPPPRNVVRVGGDVKAPTKIKNVPPVYPAIAQTARVQGVVILEAVISPTGQVESARVLRSIPLLDQAALDAVKQWEFTPTLLNGVAVPVIMTATVQFSLTDPLPALVTLTPETRATMLADLEQGRARWHAAGRAAYSLRVVNGDRSGEPPSASVIRDGKAVTGSATIESLFDTLAASIRTAERAGVTFDLKLGFPRIFIVDPSATTAGDERTTRVELTPGAP